MKIIINDISYSVPNEHYQTTLKWIDILLKTGNFPIGISIQEYMLSECIELEYRKRKWEETVKFLKKTNLQKDVYTFKKSKYIENEIINEFKQLGQFGTQ